MNMATAWNESGGEKSRQARKARHGQYAAIVRGQNPLVIMELNAAIRCFASGRPAIKYQSLVVNNRFAL